MNRRNHFRVEILVPVKWRVLKDEETALVRKGLGDRILKNEQLPSPIEEYLEQVSPGSKDEQLFRTFQLLNNKLDYIIDQIISNKLGKESDHDDVTEISASGLKFVTLKRLDPGTLLKMNLIIPGTFQYQMDLIAEIVRAEEKDQGFVTAARFIHINEKDRDSIVKVVFQKQRKDIRKIKSGESEDELD
jgi:c-di-GMP-binding flagellar brake protein YcgR